MEKKLQGKAAREALRLLEAIGELTELRELGPIRHRYQYAAGGYRRAEQIGGAVSRLHENQHAAGIYR
ncbi:MAG: hypothetical protein LUE21_00460 [Oscillospiraceae bacterium]|nr:hypothetical protein [Oscillospiraceae bacterium]